MLSEPLSITFDGNAKSLARLSYGGTGRDNSARFRSSNGEFALTISEYSSANVVRVEILLERATVDTDLSNGFQYLPNRFGFVYEFDRSQYNTSVDIPLLRSALNTFVDSALQVRLIGGEK